MGRHVALVVAKLAAQALAVDQLRVQFAGQRAAHDVPHIVAVRLAVEDHRVQRLLELLRQRGPVRAHRLQPLEHHLGAAIGTHDLTGIALLAAKFGATDGRHQEAPEVRLELEFQRAVQAEGLAQVVAPPVVDVSHEFTPDACRIVLGMGTAQPDEGGIGVAIDHVKAARLDQQPGLAHDLVAAHGDRRRQARVEEAAAARSQHAVERVHDDLQRLRERLVLLALGRLAALPDPRDDGGQAVLAAREPRAPEAGHRIGIIGVGQPLHQANRIDQERADDRRIQALVVQHQHRLVQPGAGIHDEAAGAGLGRQFAQIRRHVALPVHQRHI
ncbi:hypothetical protein D3C86_1207820 [compost metagenome]